MYHIFIHSAVDGYSGCFHVLAIVHSTAVNTGVYVSFQTMFFSACMPRIGIAGSCVWVCECECECVCISFSVVSDSLWPHGLEPARLLIHGIFQTRTLERVESSKSALDELLSVSFVFLCFPTSVGCLSAGDKSPGNKDLSLVLNSPLSSPLLPEHSLTQRHVIRNKLKQ